jgi:phosphoglycolate phosphatase-like HAD superfamily hydrolase
MSRVRGMVFDLDGTLIDSALDFDLMRHDMGLPPGRPILESLAEVPEGAAKEHMLAVLRTHELAGADRATLFPGVAQMLSFLQDEKIPIGILTRNSRESTERVLNRLALQFDEVLTREDAPPKPDPTGLVTICERWQLSPAMVPFCGDYRFDLEAGRAAGMPTVLYAPGEIPDYVSLADHVLPCFTQFADLWKKFHHAG